MRISSRRAGSALFGALVWLLVAAPGAAQFSDTVTVAPNADYSASGLTVTLFGSGYREAWATPFRVPVLDLATFAGGLEPVEQGGGLQTRTLRLINDEGVEYNFRSTDKFVEQGIDEDLEGTVVGGILQDLVSAMHPAAAIVATGLLDAVAILHPGPQLVVMPDDPKLGPFRDAFAGLLGIIELHVNEAEDGKPGFAGSVEVDGSEDVLAFVAESPGDRIDNVAYLRERLMSMLMGDWDRHAGQFRWAAFDSADVRWWIPVPEDRDFAFSSYDGRFMTFLRPSFPELVPFDSTYASLDALTGNSTELNRRLLAGLEWPVWSAVVDDLRRDLTDEEITAAVKRMPPELEALTGADLIGRLLARRDGLPVIARAFYDRLARLPEIHATDEADSVDVVRREDGSVSIRVLPVDAADGIPLLDRTFLAGETEEIWIYLAGGDDRAAVSGNGSSGPIVRIDGGEGDDVLVDDAPARMTAPLTVFHDSQGANEFDGTRSTIVVVEPFDDPVWIPGEVLPPRDWGSGLSWFVPWLSYDEDQGVIAGGGPMWTRYGFRRFPWAGRLQLRGMVGLATGELGLDARGSFLGIGTAPTVELHARASQLEDFRFHGFGNDSPELDDRTAVRDFDQLLFEAIFRYPVASEVALGVGPILEWVRPEAFSPDSPAPLLPGAYGKIGIAGELEVDSRPERARSEAGFELTGDAAFFPAAWGITDPFGRAAVAATGYLPLPLRSQLVLRGGGGRSWGSPSPFDHQKLGGWPTLRGYPSGRFVGDEIVYAGAELRAELGRLNLLTRGDLGVLAFVDTGRAYHDSTSPGGWHLGRGAGLWFETLGFTATATVAEGEDTRVYFRLERE